METHSAGAARPATAAVLLPSVLVVLMSAVLMMGDELSTNPWMQGAVVIGGFLFCLAAGVSFSRRRK